MIVSDIEGVRKRSRSEADRSRTTLGFSNLTDVRLYTLAIIADVFEVRCFCWQYLLACWLIPGTKSYIGGLHMDQGLEAVRSWLRPLFLPYALESYRIVRKEYGLPPSDGFSVKRSSPLSQLSPNTSMEASRSMWRSPPPAQYSASVGHLALFNQCLQQESKPVEWVYTGSAGEGSKTTPVWVSAL